MYWSATLSLIIIGRRFLIESFCIFANVDHFDNMLLPTLLEPTSSKWSILTRWFGHKRSKNCQVIIQTEANTGDDMTAFTIVSRSQSKKKGQVYWYITSVDDLAVLKNKNILFYMYTKFMLK